MDYINDSANNDDIDTKCRTLWVGNLHPKVTSRNLTELFYQVVKINFFFHSNNRVVTQLT